MKRTIKQVHKQKINNVIEVFFIVNSFCLVPIFRVISKPESTVEFSSFFIIFLTILEYLRFEIDFYGWHLRGDLKRPNKNPLQCITSTGTCTERSKN